MVHFGDGTLLPIHGVAPSDTVVVSFNADSGITCPTCQRLIQPLIDRRRAALMDGCDEIDEHLLRSSHVRAIGKAVETATRVRIADEIVEIGRQALADGAYGYLDRRAAHVIIMAAFRAAGLEVEE